MFRRRPKKNFPPGTFLPTSARVVAILHLCIAFTMILWYASQPFMGHYFAVKSRLAIFESVFVHPDYAQIEDGQKLILQEKYGRLASALDTSFWRKCLQSIEVLCTQIPIYEQAWLLLSVILPIYLLKRREGSWQAAWLLPLLCLAFCLDNRLHGRAIGLTAEEKLFPSEQVIVEHYLKEPMSANILEQQDQLKRGWQNYLNQEWNGEFNFIVARAEKTEMPAQMVVTKRQSYFMLGLYLLWNIYFAWTFFIHRKNIEAQPIRSR